VSVNVVGGNPAKACGAFSLWQCPAPTLA